MRQSFTLALVLAAALGGAATAVVLLGAGAIEDDGTTTVIQQAPLAAATSGSHEGAGLTPRDIYRRAAPGVVFIRARTTTRSSDDDLLPRAEPNAMTGSGFVIDEQGSILTAADVVALATRVQVTVGERTVDAKIVGKDEDSDLALLRVDPDGLDLAPLALGGSSRVQVGDPVVAIGNPSGLGQTLTTGVVSAREQRIEGPNGFTIDAVIQTDALLDPAGSGGPLIDAAGRVIGVNSQLAVPGAGQGGSGRVGFTVPVDTAKQVVPQLRTWGRVERAYLGIEATAITRSLAPLRLPVDSGILVGAVAKDSPAAAAGLRAARPSSPASGDIIQRVDEEEIATFDDLTEALAARRPGTTITLTIIRSGAERRVAVRLTDRPPRARTD